MEMAADPAATIPPESYRPMTTMVARRTTKVIADRTASA
jgi:hypothetical protein